jgi:hypothetical protein
LATVAVLVSLPAPASAFPCGETARPAAPPRQLSSVQQVPNECMTSAERRKPQKRERKKGSLTGLTVFLLAVGGALVIPIARNGIPRMADPYRHDRPF